MTKAATRMKTVGVLFDDRGAIVKEIIIKR